MAKERVCIRTIHLKEPQLKGHNLGEQHTCPSLSGKVGKRLFWVHQVRKMLPYVRNSQAHLLCREHVGIQRTVCQPSQVRIGGNCSGIWGLIVDPSVRVDILPVTFLLLPSLSEQVPKCAETQRPVLAPAAVVSILPPAHSLRLISCRGQIAFSGMMLRLAQRRKRGGGGERVCAGA